jgi:hypothetical protein
MIEGAIGGAIGAIVGFFLFAGLSRRIHSAAARKARRLGVPPRVLADGTCVVGWPPGLLGVAARFSLWIWATLTLFCGLLGAWIGVSLG